MELRARILGFTSKRLVKTTILCLETCFRSWIQVWRPETSRIKGLYQTLGERDERNSLGGEKMRPKTCQRVFIPSS